ncbi:MAG: alpha/beta hydrolase [Oscillochloridaceae bacterium umkhey_bin13]
MQTLIPPTATAPIWQPDLLSGCEFMTLDLPAAADGPVVATLVRRLPPRPNGRAVLYVHGFVDYFFQTHLAEAFCAHGYTFYALDLRRYGRSLRPHQLPNYCTDLREYYAELDAALTLIAAAGHRWLLLNGHSTGGLLAALYAHEGQQRDQIKALFLNSPFFDWYLTRSQLPQLTLAVQLGAIRPTMIVSKGVSSLYTESIHRDYRGEWAFDLRWKPLNSFPTYAGWVRAVVLGQRHLQAGLAIDCPVLLMHSARSHRSTVWSDAFTQADCVLNVAHMRQYGPGLGRDVTLLAIEGGLHDLVLSPAPARRQVFSELFSWLAFH